MYLAEFLDLCCKSDPRFKTWYMDSRRLVKPEYAKNLISANRSNVHILTSTAMYVTMQGILRKSVAMTISLWPDLPLRGGCGPVCEAFWWMALVGPVPGLF